MTYTHHLDVNDYHRGETYGSVYSKHNDKKVGHLAWSQYGNKVNIHHIQTDPEHKGKGVARGMVDRLKKEWPHNKINWGMTTPEGEAFKRAYYKKKDKKMAIKESEHLMYRASTKHLRTYLNFMKMRTAQGLSTPADEEMVKKAQKHYSTRLLHNVLTSKNIKENWEQVSDGAWINSDNTIAIAKTENGEIISLGKDGKLRKQWDTVEQAMKEETLNEDERDYTGKRVQIIHSAWGHKGKLGTVIKNFKGHIASKTHTYRIKHDDGTQEDYIKSQLQFLKKHQTNEDAPTNSAGGGAVAGIGISSPTIKNPNQSEPGVREKKRILKRFGNYFKKA